MLISKRNKLSSFGGKKKLLRPSIRVEFVYLRSNICIMNTSVATLQDALTNNIPVSHFGRTLANILCFSYPEELSFYKVEHVPASGSLVEYHRSEGDVKVTFYLLQVYFISYAYLGYPEEIGIAGGGSSNTSIRDKTRQHHGGEGNLFKRSGRLANSKSRSPRCVYFFPLDSFPNQR
jgi:hypothetical protein